MSAAEGLSLPGRDASVEEWVAYHIACAPPLTREIADRLSVILAPSAREYSDADSTAA
jgi:hypothetical protein